MKSVYVITMWSGGRPAKKWKSEEPPQPLPQGTGVTFTSVETRLEVHVIGSISIEQYESGKEEFELRTSRENGANDEPSHPAGGSNIKPFA